MGISVGDKVQIRDGGMDVTNGAKAKAGKMYGEGGPLWAVVTSITEEWKTRGKFGLPAKVTKVRCAKDGVVVWQVRPEDIAGQAVKASAPTPKPPKVIPVSTPSIAAQSNNVRMPSTNTSVPVSNNAFANVRGSNNWAVGSPSMPINSSAPIKGKIPNAATQNIGTDPFASNDLQDPTYKLVATNQPDPQSAVPGSVTQQSTKVATYKTAWQSPGRRKQMLNQNTSVIQNKYGFPYHVGSGGSMLADKYDYQIIPGDPRYAVSSTLEDRLMEVRAAIGIPVHGNDDIARSVKYYMYNRFKVPDTNLAHNRTFTHVFFTRPDLNLLAGPSTANTQTMNHTDTALIWRRHPELFKLLTDHRRCNDDNNFNMLLSNQVASFNLQDESLSTIKAGKSWAEHEMQYGEQYTGRTAGEFNCVFNETSDYSVLNIIKLWMTYIDNVSRGAWSPNYAPGWCHVYDRALDYGASAYVFKCGPDGEDVIYWSKYYGIFPTVSGSSALNWDYGTPGDIPKLSITFAYSYKKDLSPISLLEFNHVANVSGNVSWIPAYDREWAGTVRPYVGAPYIELDLGSPSMQPNDVNRGISKRTQIRLKYRRDTSDRRTDEILFKANK